MDARTTTTGVLTKATFVSTAMQLVMVLIGHLVPATAAMFPYVGTALGGVAGFLFGKWAMRDSRMGSATGGAIAGAVGGFLGAIASWGWGDVTGQTIGIAIISTLVAGMIGGAIGHRRMP